MTPQQVKQLRTQLGLSQEAFAEALGVSFATVNRWENGKAKPQKDRVQRMKAMLRDREHPAREHVAFAAVQPVNRLDFEGDPEVVKLVVDALRLQNGHLQNTAFGLELSRIVPLPHQRIAVYEHLLPQNPLRFLLADDAGAGKTIMTGLYIREMINRGRLRRVLICTPAGLTWNWRRELTHFFDLNFKILRSADFQSGNPFADEDNGLFIISVDTAATDAVRECLASPQTLAFDLAVFDEAHKLAWGDPNRADSKTRRYRLAEELSCRCTHLLLLTATPHMGKPFPYFALWRLLDSKVLSTVDALRSLTPEKRAKFFIRRLKEEMIDYDGTPIYKPRLCQTIGYRLTPPERSFYDAASEYLRWSYETNRTINKNAAAMVVAVLQRRLASSTHAMIESLKRRRQRVVEGAVEGAARLSAEQIVTYFDTSTADDSPADHQDREADENYEDQALALTRPEGAQLRKELEYLDRTVALGEELRDSLQETKFQKLRELIESTEFHNEKLLVFTEHRDTLEYLRQRFEAMGYTGQVACIHGGMDVEEREQQRIFFMPPDERRRQGVKNPDAPSARILLATDAAGEGINLQFAWAMLNYDIPWNPARLEQRMGRLHRFGQRHSEVRIFNLVAEDTREGDVLTTLLAKLEEARKELCNDKVYDVIGQQLQEVSIRDLLRETLFETAPYSAQRKLDSIFATQKLRAAVEEQRKTASTFGDVARRLGQLNSDRSVEEFHRLLPAYVQNFVERAAPRVGLQLDGDLAEAAHFSVASEDADWLRQLRDGLPNGLPEFLSVRRDYPLPGVDASRIAFLRPGDTIFDALSAEVIRRFRGDVQRGAVFCDPSADRPYYVAVYICQIGETAVAGPAKQSGQRLFDRRLLAVRWDESGGCSFCAPNHLLALQAAPRSLTWKAGKLLLNPDQQAQRADAWARMFAETNYLQQLRTVARAEVEGRLEDLMRGYDYRGGELAEKRTELAKLARQGDAKAATELEEVKKQQATLDTEKAEALLYEHRRAELLDIRKLERVALSIVVPDPTPEARETYDKNIEAIAMRIARNFEIDHYHARVFDVSSPHLARGYDLESHRANGEKVVIEVKGRGARGAVHLTDNEWPTAANVREKYWLYVVVDCATEPKLFRVRDPIRLAFKTRQTITLNIGDIIKEAEHD
jgi:superfamily II DNA or RNA helicase